MYYTIDIFSSRQYIAVLTVGVCASSIRALGMTLTGHCTEVPHQAVGRGRVQTCLERVSVHTFQFRGSLPCSHATLLPKERCVTRQRTAAREISRRSSINSSKQENTSKANLILPKGGGTSRTITNIVCSMASLERLHFRISPTDRSTDRSSKYSRVIRSDVNK